MTLTLIRRLVITLLMSLLPVGAAALDEPRSLRLLDVPGTDGNDPSVVLGEADWHWLRERRTLLMGVSAPDYAPLELTNNNDELEGITADYARLLAKALNITVEVKRYDTRDEVIEALKHGAVDFLGSANGFEDTGVGISGDDQKRLFNPFIQASNTDQSARSGSGLGLVISRNLCEMMEGELQLSSVLGQGTRVDVTLVLARTTALPDEISLPVQPVQSTRILEILVVDDFLANRLLLARQLSFLGHRAITAEDGVQGLKLWKTKRPDVVITDCNMPLKDGYSLARDIRAQEREQGLVPCLLLGFTANAQPEETERCRQAGMDGCLFKPAGLEDLRSALAAFSASPCLPEAEVGFDLGSLIVVTGDDREALKELLSALLDSLDADRAKLPMLQRRVNFRGLHDLAHRVKGGARMVNAQALVTCCETLEALCERQERAALGAAIEAVGAAIGDLHQRMSDYCKQP